MKKKSLFILLILIFCLFIPFSGCNKEPAQSGKLKVALILPSGKDDLAWSQGIYDGLVSIQKEMGEDNLEISVSEKIPNPVDAGAALRDYASRGFNIIIAHGSQFQNPVFDVADDFPDITFVYGAAFKTAENVFAYDPQSQNGGYLFGILAAKLTKSRIVGIVGPVNAGDAAKYISGFRQGIQSIDPKIKILEAYTGTFGDTVKAKEMASAHMDAGADILTGTSQQAVGAIQAVSEQKDVYWLSTDMDQISLAPKNIIASDIYKWKEVIKFIIESHKKGKHGGELILLDFVNNGQEIVFNPGLETLMKPDVKKIFDDNLDKIKKGQLKINVLK